MAVDIAHCFVRIHVILLAFFFSLQFLNSYAMSECVCARKRLYRCHPMWLRRSTPRQWPAFFLFFSFVFDFRAFEINEWPRKIVIVCLPYFNFWIYFSLWLAFLRSPIFWHVFVSNTFGLSARSRFTAKHIATFFMRSQLTHVPHAVEMLSST